MNVLLLVLNTVILLVLLWHVGREGKTRSAHGQPTYLLDTSALVDGRILEVAQAGFMQGVMLVPQFVVSELHQVADSAADLKRSRGRFGLESLRKLQAMNHVQVKLIDDQMASIEAVDDKLVALAKKTGSDIVTVDFNLNQVASVNEVRVLNVNELARALRPLVLPGEQIAIKLVQRGSDPKQAVGYLADGTMIVVDRADRLIGQEVRVEINRVMQTVAGRMMFAYLVRDNNGNDSKKA